MLTKAIQNTLNSLSIIIFFITYKTMGILSASAVLVVFSIFLFGFNYLVIRWLPISNIISLAIICIFSSMTVVTGDDKYVKLHITLLNIFFTLMLLTGILLKKNFLRFIIGDMLPSGGAIWINISKYWTALFFILAIVNEIIRTLASTTIWIYSITFGANIATFCLVIFQIRYIKKHLAIR
ncbi:intracellular septation protein [Candidatus Xenohaliotis californiensis]|uniref:Intracellular septation protein n=1 Tax=Candidatus Xenohaliotis californiensis TaxID=84677 RepID=A0ABP0EWS3_9RICK|nr:intracellular septation protein [Candidatus Xenohaliotis californiensis]